MVVGADVCVVDVTFFLGFTPLMLTSGKGYLPVVKHLIEHKADIYANNDGDEIV